MPNMELIGDFQIGQQRSFPQQIWLYVWDDMYTRENDFCVSVCVCIIHSELEYSEPAYFNTS